MRIAAATQTDSLFSEARNGFFIHRIQKGYAVWIGVLLFLYSALFFTMAFYGAHLEAMVALYTSHSLAERQIAAEEMLMLSKSVWVAVPVLFFGAVIFSLVVTRRVAGPLCRLDESIRQWAEGNLSWRLRFRPSDRLDELAETANQALSTIEKSFAQIHSRTCTLQAALSKLERAGSPDINDARNAVEEIAATVRRFHFRSPTNQIRQ
jgi:methyl-accepting chemotaxis protein